MVVVSLGVEIWIFEAEILSLDSIIASCQVNGTISELNFVPLVKQRAIRIHIYLVSDVSGLIVEFGQL